MTPARPAASSGAYRPGRTLRVGEVAPVLRVVVLAVAFLAATHGFARAYTQLGHGPDLTRDAVDALRLVVGGFPAALEGRVMPLSLLLARWALPLLTFWSTVSLAWSQLRNPWRLALIRARGEHLVVAGDAGLAMLVAHGVLARGQRVLVWADDQRQGWMDDLVNSGAAEVEAKGPAHGADRLVLGKARGLALLGADDAGNIARIGDVRLALDGARPPGDPLEVIARVDDLDLRRGVEDRFARGDRGVMRVRFASLPDLAARRLFLSQPIDAFRRAGQTDRPVLLVGFTPAIERYALRLLAAGHFRDGGKPRLIVLDRDAGLRQAAFRSRHGGADLLAPMRFVDAPLDRLQTIAEQAIALASDVVAVVVDAGDDARTLGLALALDAAWSRSGTIVPPIHARLARPPDARLGSAIRAFGGDDQVGDPDLLLQTRHDALARSVHELYLEARLADGARIGVRASMHEWDDLPESFRDDNRLVADCYRLKLRDVGARVVDGAGPPLRLDPDELETLARAEHDRWMASKLAGGWRHGPVRDDAALLHPDIVDYDALSEPIKDLDREQIRAITRMLAVSGQRALRVLTIVITPGHDAAANAVPELLERIATEYPDRVPRLIGRLEDAHSRAALMAAHVAGALIGLVTATNPQTVSDALPAREQDAVDALVRAADTMLATQADEADQALYADADLVVSAHGLHARRTSVPVP